MKQLTQYINEKLHVSNYKKQSNLELLVEIFKKEVLCDQGKIKEDDFENWNTGMHTLFNVPQSRQYYEDFVKAIKPYNDLLQYKGEQYYSAFGLKEDNSVCITFNFVTDNDKDAKIGDINSVDVSTNIKKLLLK